MIIPSDNFHKMQRSGVIQYVLANLYFKAFVDSVYQNRSWTTQIDVR